MEHHYESVPLLRDQDRDNALSSLQDQDRYGSDLQTDFANDISSSPYPRFVQGKVAELRIELTSGGRKDKSHSAKKIALKKIVANMTMSNNDMVALFPDIVQCMQIPSLEIKKMYSRKELLWMPSRH